MVIEKQSRTNIVRRDGWRRGLLKGGILGFLNLTIAIAYSLRFLNLNLEAISQKYLMSHTVIGMS